MGWTLLTNLFSKKDGSIQTLESLRLNPKLVSNNELRNDLEFYIPQLCMFILFCNPKSNNFLYFYVEFSMFHFFMNKE